MPLNLDMNGSEFSFVAAVIHKRISSYHQFLLKNFHSVGNSSRKTEREKGGGGGRGKEKEREEERERRSEK